MSHRRAEEFHQTSAPIVVLIRQPIDQVASHFHNLQARSQKADWSGSATAWTPDEFALAPGLGIDFYLRSYTGWATAIDRGQAAAISYEQLKADPVATMLRLFDYLGVPVSRESATFAADYSTFERMVAAERQQHGARPNWEADPNLRRTREGKVGTGSALFSQSAVAAMEERFATAAPELRALVQRCCGWCVTTGCPTPDPDGAAVASALVSAPEDWQVLAYGAVKQALTAVTDLTGPGKEAVVVVRRPPIAGSQRVGDLARVGWDQMGERIAEAGRLLRAGATPALVPLPASDELTDAIESIVDRRATPEKPHAGERLAWQSACGSSTVWASLDVHHRASPGYAIELKQYSAWSLDLRDSSNPIFRKAGDPSVPEPMPTTDVAASLRAGRLVELGSQAIYGFTAEQMRAWLMSDQEEPPGLLQRRGVTVAGELRFRPTPQQWATSMRDIERGGDGVLDMLVAELVRSLADLRRAQEVIPQTGLDVHRLRAEVAAGRGRDILLAAGLGGASVVAVALPDAQGVWCTHTHFVDVDPWTPLELDAWCQRVV